ncbi:MAG TPA: NAD-dependent epimerase/dehydratase family protein [Cytophagaceae bacterium]|jgi:UDP-glucuronate decarboxylase|nr:NAD-dependent epimerase/dehydratase family protein [Cytophagaceae bacterium]
MKKILITGGAGNIGSALASALVQLPETSVVIVDNLVTGTVSKIPLEYKNLVFIKADANSYHDMAAIMLSHRFDCIFHYAALVGVKRTLDNPIMVLKDIQGIQNILELAKNTGVKRVYFSSSSEVYGEPVEFPQNEITTPLNSRLPYAIVKNVCEAYLKSYYKEYGLNYTIFRFFNTYGPNQSTDFVIPRFLQKALKNEDISIYGNGSQTRTFCYINDNIELTTKTFLNDLCINETVNVGSDKEITILELARQIVKTTGSKSKIIHLPPLEEGDMTRRLPDINKMRKILNRELTTLEQGLPMLSKFIPVEN